MIYRKGYMFLRKKTWVLYGKRKWKQSIWAMSIYNSKLNNELWKLCQHVSLQYNVSYFVKAEILGRIAKNKLVLMNSIYTWRIETTKTRFWITFHDLREIKTKMCIILCSKFRMQFCIEFCGHTDLVERYLSHQNICWSNPARLCSQV